ncbi:MAG: isoaspartyl peptidase/L-asparaginase [Erysipelotrichaceae bacterium]|jgi:isoaspartyl peptidase/L-asparaginase-like protein (Ntn-hydrolase superfamily)|nr:isoaspartyl peptidase/L-asparaginase [Erysipelotrichaceae bacterium]
MPVKMIGTWLMPYKGMQAVQKEFAQKPDLGELIERVICTVEDEPHFHSVGFSGWPNRDGIVELDAGYMDGDSLGVGAIMATHNIKNPIKVARALSTKDDNFILAGTGAEIFAQREGFEFVNLLTDEAKDRWQKESGLKQKAYEGHDTVCVLGLDDKGRMISAISTSGLFMKHPGRVGDSPLIGSGFYADSTKGAAAATGYGEDILRGVLSLRIVDLMGTGVCAQEACETVLQNHVARLNQAVRDPRGMSVIAIDKDGNIGAATDRQDFPFVVADENGTVAYVAKNMDGRLVIEEAGEEFIQKNLYW